MLRIGKIWMSAKSFEKCPTLAQAKEGRSPKFREQVYSGLLPPGAPPNLLNARRASLVGPATKVRAACHQSWSYPPLRWESDTYWRDTWRKTGWVTVIGRLASELGPQELWGIDSHSGSSLKTESDCEGGRDCGTFLRHFWDLATNWHGQWWNPQKVHRTQYLVEYFYWFITKRVWNILERLPTIVRWWSCSLDTRSVKGLHLLSLAFLRPMPTSPPLLQFQLFHHCGSQVQPEKILPDVPTAPQALPLVDVVAFYCLFTPLT